MAKDLVRVLILQRDENQSRVFQSLLAEQRAPRFEVRWSQTLEAAMYCVGAFAPDVLVIDPDAKEPYDPDLVQEALKAQPSLPIILLCKPKSVKYALETVGQGPLDYLVEGAFDVKLLSRVLRWASERRALAGEAAAAASRVKEMEGRLGMAEKALTSTQSTLREQARSLEQANEQLQKMNLELKKIDQLKSQFLSIVTHDLNSPLSVILGYLEVLLKNRAKLSDPAEIATRLETMQESARRLEHLVNQILKISELEMGKVNLNYECVDPGALVSGLIKGLAAVASKKQQVLTADIPEGLPKAWLDVRSIERVVTNLVTNAHKYSPAGGPIRVSVRPEQDMVRFEVADSGPGIPPESRSSVFDRFTRLTSDPAVPRMPGLGLGLAICREIVSQHRGRIWVEGNPGGGSLFTFLLPRDPRVERGAKRNILLVEDDSEIRAFLESLLVARGHNVTTAADGLKGIERLQQRTQKFDLVLTDLQMPGANGVQVIENARLSQPQALVAVMSSHTNSDVFFEAMSKGPMTFIAKPFREEHVHQALTKLLSA